jgi:hypothetical protein
MLEQRVIKEHLERSTCHKCGCSLVDAKLLTISEAPMAFMAHAICPQCQSGTVVTITPQGSGNLPLITDLIGSEIKDFMVAKPLVYEDLFDLHKLLKKENLWNLLHKKEKNLEKK